MKSELPIKNINKQSLKFSSVDNIYERTRVFEAINYMSENKRDFSQFSNDDLFATLVAEQDPDKRIKIRDIIFEKNLGLLFKKVDTILKTKAMNLDILSDLYCSLYRCIDNFDLARDRSFSTFANKVMDNAYNTYWYIHNRKKRQIDGETLFYEDMKYYISDISINEAERLDIPILKTDITPCDKLDKEESKRQAQQLFNNIADCCLTPNQKEAFIKKLGLDGNQYLLKDIAADMNISHQRVYDLYDQAIYNFQKYFDKHPKKNKTFIESLQCIITINEQEQAEQEKFI